MPVDITDIGNPDQLVLIRVGSCGATKEYMNNGDLVISTGAVRLEDTSLAYVDNAYPSVAHYEVLQALIYAAKKIIKNST